MKKTFCLLTLLTCTVALASTSVADTLVVNNNIYSQLPYYTNGVEHYYAPAQNVPINVYVISQSGTRTKLLSCGANTSCAQNALPANFTDAGNTLAFSFGGMFNMKDPSQDSIIGLPPIPLNGKVTYPSETVPSTTVGYVVPGSSNPSSSQMICFHISYQYITEGTIHILTFATGDNYNPGFCEIL